MSTASGYLRHVDGLRGVSVLLVVLYHAWPDTIPGGFIGLRYLRVLDYTAFIGRACGEDVELSWFFDASRPAVVAKFRTCAGVYHAAWLGPFGSRRAC